MAAAITVGSLVLTGYPRRDGSVSMILRSERGDQEVIVSFEEWTTLTQLGSLGVDEIRRLRGIEKVATTIGAHWRDQHGCNAGLLDLLAEVVRHG